MSGRENLTLERWHSRDAPGRTGAARARLRGILNRPDGAVCLRWEESNESNLLMWRENREECVSGARLGCRPGRFVCKEAPPGRHTSAVRTDQLGCQCSCGRRREVGVTMAASLSTADGTGLAVPSREGRGSSSIRAHRMVVRDGETDLRVDLEPAVRLWCGGRVQVMSHTSQSSSLETCVGREGPAASP